MDSQQKAESRRQGLEDSVDLSQDMTRVAKRAGRISTAPKNVTQDASGRRVVGPTSAQIQAGTANPAFYASRERQSNISSAKAAGTFAQTRLDYNNQNKGKAQMDDSGNITQSAKPPVEFEYGTGGGVRVKKAPPAPAPGASAGTGTAPSPAPAPAPGASAAPGAKPPTPVAAPKKPSLIDGKPAAQWFKQAANRQGRPNSYGSVQPDAKPAVVSSPTPTAKAAMAKSDKEIDAKYPTLFGNKPAVQPAAPATQTPAPKAPVVASTPPTTPANATQSSTKPSSSSASLGSSIASIFGRAGKAAASMGSELLSKLPKPVVEYEDLPTEKRNALVRAEKSSPTMSALNPTQIAQGGKSSVADQFPGIGAPATNATAPERITNDKAAVRKMTSAGVLRNQTRKEGGYVNRVAQQAKLKFRMNGGRVNPFKTHLNGYMKGGCAHKVKPMKDGGGMPEDEVVMVGEEGPEMIFKRKDGSMFVTPTDVTKQIMNGIEMEPTEENEEAMRAAKKRASLTPRKQGGEIRDNAVDDAANKTEMAAEAANIVSRFMPAVKSIHKTPTKAQKLGGLFKAAGKVAGPIGVVGMGLETKNLAADPSGVTARKNEELNNQGPLRRAWDGVMNPVTNIVTAAEEGKKAIRAVADTGMSLAKEAWSGPPTPKLQSSTSSGKPKTKLRPKMFGGPVKPKPLGGKTLGGPLSTNMYGNLEPGQSDARGPLDSGERLIKDGIATSPQSAQEYQQKLHGANTQARMDENRLRAEAGLPTRPMPTNPFQRPGQY